MNYNIFKSRTFWTVVAMFVVGGGNAILPVIPPAAQTILEALLGLLAAYFHNDTGQKLAAAKRGQ